MSSISSVTGINDYSFLFNNTSSSTSNAYNIFSGSTNVLGDYSMIKSGVYKKLLTAYYEKNGTTSTDSTSDTNSTDSTVALTNVKSAAQDLSESADALGKSSLYKTTGVDENGKYTYDRDSIKNAVRSFVSDYNAYMESAGDADSLGILSKTLNIQKATASNQTLLKSVGISIGKDNTLTLDEETLDSANISDLTSLFKGSGSYGNSISSKATEVYKLANNSALSNTHASSYTFNGTYSTLGKSNGSVNTYL